MSVLKALNEPQSRVHGDGGWGSYPNTNEQSKMMEEKNNVWSKSDDSSNLTVDKSKSSQEPAVMKDSFSKNQDESSTSESTSNPPKKVSTPVFNDQQITNIEESKSIPKPSHPEAQKSEAPKTTDVKISSKQLSEETPVVISKSSTVNVKSEESTVNVKAENVKVENVKAENVKAENANAKSVDSTINVKSENSVSLEKTKVEAGDQPLANDGLEIADNLKHGEEYAEFEDEDAYGDGDGEDLADYEVYERENQQNQQQYMEDVGRQAAEQRMEGQDDYYYDDEEYYEDDEEGAYEDEEETYKELVRGPNGRLQYVVKGADGRIKCIMDAPADAVLEETPIEEQEDDGHPDDYPNYSQGGNGDLVEGENEDFYEDGEELEYEEGEELEYQEGAEQQYKREEGEISNPYEEYNQRQQHATGTGESGSSNKGEPHYSQAGMEFMDDEDEEYNDEEGDDEFEDFTEEQLTQLRKHHQQLLQKRQQEQQQQQLKQQQQRQLKQLQQAKHQQKPQELMNTKQLPKNQSLQQQSPVVTSKVLTPQVLQKNQQQKQTYDVNQPCASQINQPVQQISPINQQQMASQMNPQQKLSQMNPQQKLSQMNPQQKLSQMNPQQKLSQQQQQSQGFQQQQQHQQQRTSQVHPQQQQQRTSQANPLQQRTPPISQQQQRISTTNQQQASPINKQQQIPQANPHHLSNVQQGNRAPHVDDSKSTLHSSNPLAINMGETSQKDDPSQYMDEDYCDEDYCDEDMEGEDGGNYDSSEDFLNSKEYMEMVQHQRMSGNQTDSGMMNLKHIGAGGQPDDYYDDEEEYYDEEEEGLDEDDNGSDDSAIEAFIQRAVEEKKKEQQVRGLLQYRPKQLGVNTSCASNISQSQNPSQAKEQTNISRSQIPSVSNTITSMPNLTDVNKQFSDNTGKQSSAQSGTMSQNPSQDSANNSTPRNNILNSISFNNLKFKDGDGPVQNMVYLIRSNQGRDIYAMWDGTKFVPTPSNVSPALPSEALANAENDSKIVGGGAGRGKGQMLKENDTGPNMSRYPEAEERRPRPGPRNSNMVSLKMAQTPVKREGDLLPNGRVWRHTPNSNLLARRPLHPETSVDGKEVEDENVMEDANNSLSQGNNSGGSNSLKRPLDTSRTYAACKSCGYSSGDTEKCERCYRKFPPETNVHTGDSAQQNHSNITFDKKSFYGHKISEQSQPYKYTKLSNQQYHLPQGEESLSKKTRGSPKKPRSKPRRPLNVTVTISSDEEYSDSNEAPSTGTPGNILQDFSNTSGDSPIYPSQRETPKPHTGSLRDRMEDQNGKVVNNKKKRDSSRSTEPIAGCILPLNARSIRIGSLKSKPIESIFMSETGMECYVLCERKGNHKCRFEIEAEDIVNCQGHLNPPVFVMFLTLTAGCGVKLRERLKMKNASQDMYFDPESEDCKQKYCVVILDKLDNAKRVRQYIHHYQKVNNAGPNYYQELTHEEANQFLLKTTPLTAAMQAQVGLQKALANTPLPTPPPVSAQTTTENSDDGQREEEYHREEMENFDQAEYREESRSPTPPRVTFSGPVEKLLTYPPPPAKGALAVTNEDLYCLNEGEFLNDVIIDFYLKYLLLEKLSEEDRQRTHVFSSFFYKRLTHKIPKTEEEKKQPSLKRHARVKTWTRHVDLFEKDFIIVPINEHSHWFLAIICYPGLEEPQFCPFLPVPLKLKPTPKTPPQTEEPTPETESANNETKSEEKEIPQETDEIIPSKVITGIPLDPEKCIEESDNREYCLGKKQPCILIFDSLAGPSRAAVCRILKEYLQVEWNIKKGAERTFKEMRGTSPKIPQQNNFSDCGIYVLQYVQSFFESPIMDYAIPMKGLDRWFLPDIVANKRDDIKNLVLRLQELYPRSEKKS